MKIKANEIVKDIKTGMSFPVLMKKHQIPTQEKLKNILKQLIKAGHLKQSDLKRKKPSFECPACSHKHTTEFDECPACGVILSKYLTKKAEPPPPPNREPIIDNTQKKVSSEKIKKPITIGLIASWIFGVLFFIAGVSALFTTPLAGLCHLLAASLLLPPSRDFVYSKTNFKIPAKAKAFIILALFIASGVFTGQRIEKDRQLAAAQKAKEEQILAEKIAKKKAEKAARIKQKNIEYFKNNKSEILQEAKQLINDKQYQQAVNYIQQYTDTKDKNIEILSYEAKGLLKREKAAIEQEKQEKARIAQARAEEKKRKESERKNKVHDARELCMKTITKRAKFPSSLDIHYILGTSSAFLDNGAVLVHMNFDAKNSFGNEIPQKAICVCKDGQLLSFNVKNR